MNKIKEFVSYLKDKEKCKNKLTEIQNLIESTNKKYQDLLKTKTEYSEEIANLYKQKEELNKYIINTKGQILTEELNAYTIPEKSSENIKHELDKINNKISSLIANDELILYLFNYTVDGSDKKGKIFQKNYCENLIIGFNAYFDKKLKAISTDNYSKSVDLIKNNFDKMNKRADVIGASLSQDYLDLKLQSLKAYLDIKIKTAEEKAVLAEEKRRVREQELLLEEIANTKKQLAKEKAQYEKALGKAVSEEEVQKIKQELENIAKREYDCEYRLAHSTSGWLYIISTKAMPGILKIGVTRRLRPMDRIKELSSASVPFPFIVHGFVFSDKVFDLETNVHQYFDNRRTNTENKHKEFFNISSDEAIQVLKEKFNCEVITYNLENFDEEFEENT